MKLKKIVSLALAGVMAVSMLAGCAGKGETAGSKTEVTTGAAYGVSAKIGALMEKDDAITLSDNAAYTSYLSAVLEDLDLKNSDFGKGQLNEAAKQDLVDALNTKFENNVVGYKSLEDLTGGQFKELYTKDGVYFLPGVIDGQYSEDVVLKGLADILDEFAELFEPTVTDAENVYTCKYTGSVSLEKVTDGSVSIWVFLFVLDVDSTATKIDA